MLLEISVNKAIARGHLIVNVPVFFILFGVPGLAIYLAQENIIPDWGMGISLLIAFVLAWTVWSIMITKWRTWAFANVRNVHELKKRAIEEKLIWRDGSFFEKTEIRSDEDFLALKKIEKKFKAEDIYREDFSLPANTEIFLSKLNIYVGLAAAFLAATAGGFLLTMDGTKNLVIGSIMLLIGFYGIVKKGKMTLIKDPQLVIDSNGIEFQNNFIAWSAIENEEVIVEGLGNDSKSFLVYFSVEQQDEGIFQKIEIDSLDVTHRQLENIIRTYRIRYNKVKVYKI